MFLFLKSDHAKLRDNAKNWLYLASKVYHFRKDLLSEGEVEKLTQLSEAVKAGLKLPKGESERLRSAVESLQQHMEQVGGNYYPRSSLAENVEFFFAAIIIYVGFTTFFIKPFKIPTNSMWPSYYGMTGEVYHEENAAPSGLEKAFRFVAYGAKHYSVKAPASGELLVPVYMDGSASRPHFLPAKVKRYFVINSPGYRYSFFVGDKEVSFKAPQDFDVVRQVARKLNDSGKSAPFNHVTGLSERTVKNRSKSEMRLPALVRSNSGLGSKTEWRDSVVYVIKTGIMVEEGDPLLEFDLLTGDQLFVDRMSYHFVEPKVGDGFVFKTGDIPKLRDDKFYIKRLAGTPGDAVRIEDGDLYINDAPAAGSEAFDLNAKGIDSYGGYFGMWGMPEGHTVTVPENSFMALGDNSQNSLDSRYWGFVPEKSVVGRPILIYYPFTRRFGLTK